MISMEILARTAAYRDAYQTAKPFKHVCIDDFFTEEAAAASLRDFPPFDREFAKNEFGEYGGKAVVSCIREISPFYADLYDYFLSREFLDAMSAITGIENLHGDPALFGGGTHENLNGQSLDVHVDYNFQLQGGFHRRCNLLLYLNREWDPAWGGAIELHSDPRRPDVDRCELCNVIFNRAVIFETNEKSRRGFRAIRLPKDRGRISRKCLSICLHTPARPPG
ncbi:MAG TPA: 2OG-Fe(II) oxygenase [Caulobacteraceae bacterium]|nr:2OG-Fe(II) oxygenase [Caulobacteraceae bacterium]